MSIDRLSSTAALIAALRSDATRKNGANRATSSATAKASGRHAAPSGRPDIAKLRRELVKMVKDIPLDDAEAIRDLRPRMVRSILLWEFGPRLREHPDWRPMLDSIVQTLESDSSQLERFVSLIGELRRGK